MIECVDEEVKKTVVKEKKRRQKITEANITREQLQRYAMRRQCFTRDLELDIVYCPKGHVLRHKSRHRDGEKYCTKSACSKCMRPCTTAKFKEVVFREGQKILGDKRRKRA